MYLEVYTGPMFSGKTTSLQTRYRQYSKKKEFTVRAFKPKRDTRCSCNTIRNHPGQEIPAISVEQLCDIVAFENDIILLEESQWFPDLYDFIQRVKHVNCRIYVAGLLGDIKQEKFGQICDILPLASKITFLSSVCERCGDEAAFSKRRGSLTERDVVGGDELYYTVCSKHLYSETK